MEEKIGKVRLNYDYYEGKDLYNDGDEIETRILNIVKNEEDYEYYHNDYQFWPVLYHLSRQRENIIEPMHINETDTVLEVGAGMGAVTGAIAKKCKEVDCIELSKRRSLINAYRHKNMDNIKIIVGNFKNIKIVKKYDVITLIGVLEYAYHYIEGKEPYQEFIKKLAECLKPGGRIYIAIENKLGLKYFAGYPEDHLGKIYAGLEGYERSDKVRTFTRTELKSLVEKNGFYNVEFYYPFPDYKLPTVIYHESILKDADIEFKEISNYDSPILYNFNLNRVYEKLKGTEERKDLANSFLIEAVKR